MRDTRYIGSAWKLLVKKNNCDFIPHVSAWLDTLPLLGYIFSCHLIRELHTHTHTVERLWTFDIWLVLLSAVWKKEVGHLEYNRWLRTHSTPPICVTHRHRWAVQLNRTKKIKTTSPVFPNVKSIVRTMANTKLITCSPAGLSLWKGEASAGHFHAGPS
jgi:hypothetical protein